jgi:hypothetical protein
MDRGFYSEDNVTDVEQLGMMVIVGVTNNWNPNKIIFKPALGNYYLPLNFETDRNYFIGSLLILRAGCRYNL